MEQIGLSWSTLKLLNFFRCSFKIRETQFSFWFHENEMIIKCNCLKGETEVDYNCFSDLISEKNKACCHSSCHLSSATRWTRSFRTPTKTKLMKQFTQKINYVCLIASFPAPPPLAIVKCETMKLINHWQTVISLCSSTHSSAFKERERKKFNTFAIWSAVYHKKQNAK